MGLVLAVDVTVGIADVDLTKCGKEVNAGTIGSPEFGGAEFSVTNIAGEQWAATIISGCLQGLQECTVAWRHIVAHFL